MNAIDRLTLSGIGSAPAPARSGAAAAGGPRFADLLKQAGGEGVRFSRHAQDRLQRRSIAWTPQHSERLEQAVGRAEARGARESLVLLDDLALVVSVRNRTVITATDAQSRGDNVFTNIDSAVIA